VPKQSARAPPTLRGNIFSHDSCPKLDGLETQFVLLLGLYQATP
jgi:hypothetical protein